MIAGSDGSCLCLFIEDLLVRLVMKVLDRLLSINLSDCCTGVI